VGNPNFNVTVPLTLVSTAVLSHLLTQPTGSQLRETAMTFFEHY